MKRVIAADYDGTWDKNPSLWGLVDVIITGNHWSKYDELMNRWTGPKRPVYFNTQEPNGEMMQIVGHKASILNALKAKRYYEDQEEQANILKIMCPETEIITVPSEERTFI